MSCSKRKRSVVFLLQECDAKRSGANNMYLKVHFLDSLHLHYFPKSSDEHDETCMETDIRTMEKRYDRKWMPAKCLLDYCWNIIRD